MTTQERELIGCESYLYAKTKCCLHACWVQDCPEPICAMDFPGGVDAYRRFVALRNVLVQGMDINQAAETLNISVRAAQRLFNKCDYVIGK